MGVQTYLLCRLQATITIGGSDHSIGTLRRFFKITEIDDSRRLKIDVAKRNLCGKPAPLAVMVVDPLELPLAASPTVIVNAYLVLGWDEDRSEVTDYDWEHLPVLGYAVKDSAFDRFVLHELRDNHLHPLQMSRALELGFVSETGELLKQLQPAIKKCVTVRPFISGYAEAKCILDNGRVAEIFTRIKSDVLPQAAWYLGKRPVEVRHYSK